MLWTLYDHVDIFDPMPPTHHFGMEHFGKSHFGTRIFWHHGHFGTWTFRHMDILAPCKAIWKFWHRHFSTCAIVPKCPFAKMSLCQNFPVSKIPRAKKSPCWNVPMLKRPSAGTSAAPNGAHAEIFPRWKSFPKWLLMKCSVLKWWVGRSPSKVIK